MNPSHPRTLADHLSGYCLCARAEGKSPRTVVAVSSAVHYFEVFLVSEGQSTEVSHITHHHLRAYILYLKERRCFDGHPFTPARDYGLSGHTINGYLRGLSAFFSWLKAEEILIDNPFARVKIPRPPQKLIRPFTEAQLRSLFAVIDTSRPLGFRDHTVLLVFLDCALRLSELSGLRLNDVFLESGMLRVWGKGDKERMVPMGRQVGRQLYQYMSRIRPEPAMPRIDHVFLTGSGRPLTKSRVEAIVERYGRQAGIEGVRLSPHTLRHTAAITFLRNGGDVFSLQRLLGHSNLEMTRHYCQVADSDVARAHRLASPVDNLALKPNGVARPVSESPRSTDRGTGGRFPGSRRAR